MDYPLKCCTGCGKEFPLSSDYFHRDKTKSDGFHPKCKSCRSDMAKTYFLKNSEEILRKGAQWKADNPDKVAAQTKLWAKLHPEQRREISKRFRDNNPGKNTEIVRRWREANREQYREIDRKYRAENRDRQRQNAQRARENNRERYRNYSRQRYAQQKGNGGILTVEDVQRQYEAQQGRCYWCSKSVEAIYQVDHVIPVTRGGLNSPENVVIACSACNRSKSNKLAYTEWVPPKPLNAPTDQ